MLLFGFGPKCTPLFQCFPPNSVLNLEGVVLDLKLFKNIRETRLTGKCSMSQSAIEENPANLGDM